MARGEIILKKQEASEAGMVAVDYSWSADRLDGYKRDTVLCQSIGSFAVKLNYF
ncbi:MAG: hypothetical protein LBI40_01250 [Treponema sp.]|nr:hypothetical protein [Treponema sp.]